MKTLSLFGAVVSDSSAGWYWDEDEYFTPKQVKKFLKESEGDDVTFEIDSPGGHFFAGIAIHNLIKEYAPEATVKVMGLAGSAASIIALAGKTRHISDGAMFFIHEPQIGIFGSADELRDEAENLDAMTESAVGIYNNASNSKFSEKLIREMLKKETYLTAKESDAYGLATLVTPNETSAKATAQVTHFEKFKAKREMAYLNKRMELNAIQDKLDRIRARAQMRGKTQVPLTRKFKSKQEVYDANDTNTATKRSP